MPGRDGTGPAGTYENCVPTDSTPYVEWGRGFGRGSGRGFGRGDWRGSGGSGGGRGRGFGQESRHNPRGELRPRFQRYDRPITPEEERNLLEAQRGALQRDLAGIEGRIASLSKKE